jgi:hypothetical protein
MSASDTDRLRFLVFKRANHVTTTSQKFDRLLGFSSLLPFQSEHFAGVNGAHPRLFSVTIRP